MDSGIKILAKQLLLKVKNELVYQFMKRVIKVNIAVSANAVNEFC